MDAMDAMDAVDAVDVEARGRALQRFASWCINYGGWAWYRWELSWIVTTHIGAQQLRSSIAWAASLFDAYVAGAWILYWTDDTLYWVAKPTVHVEQLPDRRRLHNDNGPAIESDAENLYFVRGVLVPAFVVVRPDWITTKHITDEPNAEVRRIMLERFGAERYVKEIGAKAIDRSDFGTLYRAEFPDDEALVMVQLTNSTAEPDGSFKEYWLRVPPAMQRAREAVAWSFGTAENDYAPIIQT